MIAGGSLFSGQADAPNSSQAGRCQAAIARLAEAQKAVSARQSWAAKFQQSNETRVTREIQLEHHQRAQTEAAVTAYNQQEDSKFGQWFGKEFPGHKLSDLTPYVRQALVKSGVDDAKINQLWRSGALRGLETQQILAKAGMYEMAQEKSRSIASKRVPPVNPLPPGVVPIVRGAGSEENIRNLERALDGATGDRAVRLATKLQQQRRAAGR